MFRANCRLLLQCPVKNSGTIEIDTPIRIGAYGKGGQDAKTGLYKIDLPDGDYLIRKLTPVEAERLQTLPDNYTAQESIDMGLEYQAAKDHLDYKVDLLVGMNCYRLLLKILLQR